MPRFRYLRPDMRRCLNVLAPVLFAFALSCASLEQPRERVDEDMASTSVASSTPAEESVPTTAPATPLNPSPRGASVRLADGRTAPVVRVVPRDHISAVFDPVHVHAADVGEQVGPASLVIGVSIGGESVAYSVSYLSGREVVNDTVGGAPIVVTW